MVKGVLIAQALTGNLPLLLLGVDLALLEKVEGLVLLLDADLAVLVDSVVPAVVDEAADPVDPIVPVDLAALVPAAGLAVLVVTRVTLLVNSIEY